MMSAVARSMVYLVTMIRAGAHGETAVVLVEVAYVLLTAGLYAGLQQRALAIRLRMLGNGVVVLGVPGLAQTLDWLVHRGLGAPTPGRATLAVCIFTALSALFHLHVMRRGAFLSGRGCTLVEDLQRMPRLIAGFVVIPFAYAGALLFRGSREIQSETAL